MPGGVKNWAWSDSIPIDPEKAVDVNLILTNDQFFINIAAIGFPGI